MLEFLLRVPDLTEGGSVIKRVQKPRLGGGEKPRFFKEESSTPMLRREKEQNTCCFAISEPFCARLHREVIKKGFLQIVGLRKRVGYGETGTNLGLLACTGAQIRGAWSPGELLPDTALCIAGLRRRMARLRSDCRVGGMLRPVRRHS
jgi:hypothetical protein